MVDTNVPIVANHRDGGSYECASACARELIALRDKGTLVVDSAGLILAEYRKYLNYKGQSGAGDAFLRWFFNNRGKIDLCCEVDLAEIEHPWRLFEQFPDDQNLCNFDKSDQKFIAVARGADKNAQVLQASDHKWIAWAQHLQAHAIRVKFLCEAELRLTASRKQRA